MGLIGTGPSGEALGDSNTNHFLELASMLCSTSSAAARFTRGILASFMVVWSSPICAQYAFNPKNADEQRTGVKFFGSAKSSDGELLPLVALSFPNAGAVYIVSTDEMGRFRTPPLETDFDKANTKIKCFKGGFVLEKLSVRPGPKGPRPTVQVDCVLRAENRP